MRTRTDNRKRLQQPIVLLTAVLLYIATIPLMARTSDLEKQGSWFEIYRDHFDHIRYDPQMLQKRYKLRLLISDVQHYADQHPRNPKNMALLGMIFAYQAKMTEGFGALSSAREARKLLEAAIALEENVLDGSTLVCTGTLYALVPIWPIGFRDDKRAGLLIEKAYKLNPHNIDVLFYYAYYQYYKLHQTERALNVLKAALALPLPERGSFSFLGRRGEVEKLLQKIQRTMRNTPHGNKEK